MAARPRSTRNVQHGQHPDAEGQGGGDDAAEDDDQQEDDDGKGDGLGALEIAADLRTDLVEDLGEAADAHVDHAVVPGEPRGEILHPLDHLIVVASDARQHEGAAAVIAVQRRRRAE